MNINKWKYNLKSNCVEEQPTHKDYETEKEFLADRFEHTKRMAFLRSIPVNGTVSWADGEDVTGKFEIKYYNSPKVKDAWWQNSLAIPIKQEQPYCKAYNSAKEMFNDITKGWDNEPENESQEQSQNVPLNVWYHLREVVFAANRMRDNYSEGDEAVKRSLWTALHTKADAARDFYEDNKPKNVPLIDKEHELFEWVKAWEELSGHMEQVCCRKRGSEFWFTAYWDYSRRVYVTYNNNMSWIPKEEVEWLKPLATTSRTTQ